ncbi:efflux RND transporter permease subunit [Halosquirtibacter laminarini]|uniref:Efflux RND transporter permease subunit n=1 Tax=Halosquirtibacter laminarini TaxID=3374600 RepID=A0AC61NDN8_9BACT|nr:efflux RND transporter permease subunit [Prolixibacteraceae bacterium]
MHKEIVRRPIAVGMVFLSLAILGVVSLLKLPIAMLPKVSIPQITVRTQMADASATVLEQQVVQNLRNSLMQLPHLKDIHSDSRDGSGTISLRFYYGTDIDRAFVATHEKIDRTLSMLPKELERPQVMKASVTDLPVCYIQVTPRDSVTSTNFLALSKFVHSVVLRRLEQIPEVAMVDQSGVMRSQIVLIPNSPMLQMHHITMDDLERYLRNSQVHCNDLRVVDGAYEFFFSYNGSIQTRADLEKLYYKHEGVTIPLKELVSIEERMVPHQGLVLDGGKRAISLAVIQKSEARFQDLKASLNEVMNDLTAAYPSLHFEVNRDQTTLLSYAIENLKQSLWIGALLAVIVMFFFMKDFRVSLLMTITIPISLVICFMGFYWLHITMNLISISGLILGVGMMIDNAIIVMDNITQHRERGASLEDACVVGASEVFKPMLSSALTTCAVFVPLIFLSGISGALFYDQAMAITLGLGISLLVSVTFLPVVYRLIFQHDTKVDFKETHWVEKLIDIYERCMIFCMRRRGLILSLSLVVMVAGGWIGVMLPKQMIPTVAQNEFGVKISWNRPVTLVENRNRVTQILDGVKDKTTMSVAYVGTQDFVMFQGDATGVGDAMLYLSTAQSDSLDVVAQMIVDGIYDVYPEASVSVVPSENFLTLFLGGEQAPVQARFLLDDMENISPLHEVWDGLENLSALDTVPEISLKEVCQIELDPIKMQAWSIDPQQVEKMLKRTLGQETILTVSEGVSRVPVVLTMPRQKDFDFMNKGCVLNGQGDPIPLSHIAKGLAIERLKNIEGGTVGSYYPLDINHVEQLKDANLLMSAINKVVDRVKNVSVVYGGSIWERDSMINELIGVFVVSLLLLYLIMTIQFESFVLPFIVLVEVPIDLFGVMGMLWIFGQSINLMSLIGVVVMSGIIINDSILKIDTIQALMIQEHMSLYRALLVGGRRRFKSIVMTSLTTIFAMIPFLFGSGIGNDLQVPLAISVIGGMTLGTLVSLFVVPLLFVLVMKRRRNGKRRIYGESKNVSL